MSRYLLTAISVLLLTGSVMLACGVFVSDGPWDLDVAFVVKDEGLPEADLFVLWPDQQAMAKSRQVRVWALDPQVYSCDDHLSGAVLPDKLEDAVWGLLGNSIPPSGSSILEGLEQRQTVFFAEVAGDDGVILYRACGSDVARKKAKITLQLACVCNPDSGCTPQQEMDDNLKDDDCDGIIDQCNTADDCPDDEDPCTDAACEDHRCKQLQVARPGAEGPRDDSSCSNNEDDDCDGLTDDDDPNCQTCNTDQDCDDGNTCTTDTCVEQNCTNQAVPDSQECDNGNYCDGPDQCQRGNCMSIGPEPCPGPDGDDDCRESCNEETKSCDSADPEGSSCDDGSSCSSIDTCRQGVCSGVPVASEFDEFTAYVSGDFKVADLVFADFGKDGTDEAVLLEDSADGDMLEIYSVTRQKATSWFSSDLAEKYLWAAATGDMDNNGQVDLLLGTSWGDGPVECALTVMYGESCAGESCSFNSPRDFLVDCYKPGPIHVEQLNDDQLPDVVVGIHPATGQDKIAVLINQTNGGLSDPKYYLHTSCEKLKDFVLADVNLDGFLDILAACTDAHYNGRFVVWLGNGQEEHADGTFTDGFSCQVGKNPVALVTGNFKKDAFLDVALADWEDEKIYLLEGKADGNFDCSSLHAVNTLGRPGDLDAADFNGDGILDLLVADTTDDNYEPDNKLEVFQGTGQDGHGDGRFASPSREIAIGGFLCPIVVRARDLDGDEISDIIVGTNRSQQENSLGVLWGKEVCQ